MTTRNSLFQALVFGMLHCADKAGKKLRTNQIMAQMLPLMFGQYENGSTCDTSAYIKHMCRPVIPVLTSKACVDLTSKACVDL